MLIGGCGAYVSAMTTLNYNSFPAAPEVMVGEDGSVELIRKRQRVEQIWENEVV
jgi:diaminopimelate decarboxylase